jgi:hypothetical protein
MGINIRPLIVVHDSCINYFPVDKLFEINEFYTEHFTKYLYDLVGVSWEFETEIGSNYYDRALVGNVSKDEIYAKGNYTSIKGILDKLDESNVPYEITGIYKGDDLIEKAEFKPNLITNQIEVFTEKLLNTGFRIDKSKYKITLKKL